MVLLDYQNILKKITPLAQDILHINETVNKIISTLATAAKKENFVVDILPGGSTAKNTFLKGDFDVDIFVRFKDQPEKSDLSILLNKMISYVEKELSIMPELVHGSRDYFSFSFKNLFFEIVPVKYVESCDAVENITDMSPLHVVWAKEKLNDNLCRDIRLAKQFCKAQGIYGAESYINGISGHVLDILTIYYGGFENLLQAVASWGAVTVIDPEKVHVDVFSELNQSKLVSPLIVIDPIDSNRNAAAAVSRDKYALFKESAKKFLENPSESFFKKLSFNIDGLKEKTKDDELLFVVEVVPLIGKRDVVITKVLKVFEFLNRHLQLNDFDVRFSGWFPDSEKSFLYFFVDKRELDSTLLRVGPPVSVIADAARFKDVHKTVFEKDGRLCTLVKRKFTRPVTCIDHLLKELFVKERTKQVELFIFGDD